MATHLTAEASHASGGMDFPIAFHCCSVDRSIKFLKHQYGNHDHKKR